MQRRRWAIGLLGCVLGVGALRAAAPPGGAPASMPAMPRMGMVFITGAGTIEGEIDDTSVPNKVVVTQRDRTKATIDKRAIDKVIFFDTPKAEFDAKMSQLKATDALGRVALAKWALGIKQPGLAKDALASAGKIDPASPEIKTLTEQADKMLAPAVPTQPAEAVKPPEGAGDPAVASKLPVRMVTAAEINQMRQLEWSDKDRSVRAQVPADVRKRYIDSGLVVPAEASKLQPVELAMDILKHGPPAMRDQVKILNDPMPLAEFHTKVNKVLQSGCIQCHTVGKLVGKNNRLALYAGDTTEAAYTNYLILNQFGTSIGGVRYEMVDRTRPEGSLLLQFALPPSIADLPHPAGPPVPSPQYNGAVKTRAEPKYKELVSWVKSLSPLPPTFDIDLTVPIAKPEAKPAPGVKPTAGGTAPKAG